jgi:hypothetical protein
MYEYQDPVDFDLLECFAWHVDLKPSDNLSHL